VLWKCSRELIRTDRERGRDRRTHIRDQKVNMKCAVVAFVAAASAEAALGFAPVAPTAPRSGVLALRAQVCARGGNMVLARVQGVGCRV
jgi:hypothetical protein